MVSQTSWDSPSLITASILTYLSLGIAFVFPFFVLALLLRCRSRMEEPSVEKRIGAIYENINLSRKSAFLFTFFFLGRRLIFVVSIFYLGAWPIFQIFFLFFQSYAMLVYLMAVRPFHSKLMNALEVVNEVSVLIAIYHLLCFTEFVPDPNLHDSIGFSLLAVTGIAFVINVMALIYTGILEIKKVVKRLLYKWGFLKHKMTRVKKLQISNIIEDIY